ncbi:Uncharacterised protein [Mycobacteroides abscessus subsp. abscessus]|nr:Uncharacterised protein [Mycobacteroides abscessus subsp. abscessus]
MNTVEDIHFAAEAADREIMLQKCLTQCQVIHDGSLYFFMPSAQKVIFPIAKNAGSERAGGFKF